MLSGTQGEKPGFVGLMLGLVVLGLVPTWWRVPGMIDAQGALALALVGYLVWRDGPSTLSLRGEPFSEGVLAVLLGSVAWAAALLADVGVVHFAMAIAIPGLWILTVRGPGAMLPVGQIVLTAALAVPFWAVLTVPLRVATAFMSGHGARLLGIEAEIGVFTIVLESGILRVAGGCAGLHFLLAAMTLAAAYGHLFVPHWTTRVKIVLIGAVAAIVGNWIRVGILVVIADVSAMESPLVSDHNHLGWIVWVLCMAPAYGLVRRIELSDAARPGDGRVVEEPKAVGASAGAGRALMVLTTVAALSGPAVWLVASLSTRPAADVTSADVLGVDAVWEVRAANDLWEPEYDGIDARAAWSFEVGAARVGGARYAFEDQRAGEEMIQDGNRLVRAEGGIVSQRVTPTGQGTARLVNEAIVRTDDGPLLVWYWYRVGGVETPFSLRAKLFEIAAQLRRSPPSELVVLHTPCGPSDCRDAALTLRRAVDAAAGGGP